MQFYYTIFVMKSVQKFRTSKLTNKIKLEINAEVFTINIL
jgi:hypothetical protein